MFIEKRTYGLLAILGMLSILLVCNLLVIRRLRTARKYHKTDVNINNTGNSFDIALDVSHASVFDNDLLTGRAEISPALFLHLGYNHAEVPRTLEEVNSIIHPDDLAAVWESVDRHARGDSPMYIAEYRIRSKSGEWIWCDGRGKIVERDRDGNPVRLFGISMDISDRKNAENELIASEKKYRALFVNANDAIILVRDGRFYDCNPMAERIYGMTRDELIGMTPGDLSPELQPDGISSHESAIAIMNRATEGIPQFFNWVHLRKNGTCFHAEISLNRLDLPDGIFVQGVVRDVTARIEADEKIIASEARYRRLVEGMMDAYCQVDLQGRYQYANEHYLHMVDYTMDELFGLTYQHVTPARWYESERNIIETQVMTRGYSEVYEKEYIRKDGTVFPVEVKVYATRDKNGTINGLAGIIRDISAKKAIELSLQKERDFNRTLIETSPVFIVAIARDGKTIMMNAAMLDVLGYLSSEVIGKDYIETFIPKAEHEHVAGIFAKIAGKSVTVNINSILRKDGSSIVVEWHGQPVFTSEGELDYVFGIGIDITEKMKVEEALRENERIFRAIFDQSFHLIGLMNPDGILLKINQTALEYAGGSIENIVGQYFWDTPWWHHSRELRNQLRDFIKRAAAGEFIRHEVTHQLMDGTLRHIDFSIKPIKDENGRVLLLIPEGRDITEKKQAEVALRESEERYSTLVNFSPESIILTGEDGRFLFVNKAAALMHGYDSAEDIIGMNSFDMIAPEEHKHMQDSFKTAMTGESIRNFETVLLRKDGTPFPALISSTTVFDDTGNVKYIIVLPTDITDRKNTEREILALNAELEERVLARTAELKASNEELEAFSYSVSHDLRAPLRVIEGFADILLEDFSSSLQEDALGLIERIKKTGLKMEQLIDDLLKLSRITSADMNLSSVNITTMSAEIISDLQYGLNGHPVEFNAHGDFIVRGDPALLRIALTNLLGNAMKFTSHVQNPEIELGMTQEDENRVYWIRDNGAGFDQTYANRLFGAFQRLHSPADFEGTGIGLAIVRRIIRRHGGNIRAEGLVDGGATFYFTLGYQISEIV